MDYVCTGVQILELANKAYDLYLAQNNLERRRLLDILLLNCTFYRGTLCPIHRKPFDLIAEGVKTQNWGGFVDDFRTCLVTQGFSSPVFEHIQKRNPGVSAMPSDTMDVEL